MTEKLCINCLHYANTFLFSHYKQVFCTNEKLNLNDVNVVTGEFLKIKEYCIDVRLDEQLCGWEGKWFEARAHKIVPTAVTTEVVKTDAKASPRRSGSRVTLEDLM